MSTFIVRPRVRSAPFGLPSEWLLLRTRSVAVIRAAGTRVSVSACPRRTADAPRVSGVVRRADPQEDLLRLLGSENVDQLPKGAKDQKHHDQPNLNHPEMRPQQRVPRRGKNIMLEEQANDLLERLDNERGKQVDQRLP